jgi:ABC-type Na+ transport system ATPase subunit NatA
VDISLRATSVAAIVGPAGTGRSSLLLALTGRMTPSAGNLIVAGHSVKDKPAIIRALTSVARLGSMVTPEPGLTVRESVDERCLIDDVQLSVGRTRFAEACTALQLDVDPSALVGTLVGPRATLVAVALAAVRVSAVIVLDDLDRGVSAATQQTLLDALIRLAKTGPAIVVTTTDRIPVMEADVVIDLTPADGPAVWQIGPGVPGTGQSRLPLHAGPPGVEQPQLESGASAAEPGGEGYDHDDPPTQVIVMPDPGLPGVGDPAADPPKPGWSSPQWPGAVPSDADWPVAETARPEFRRPEEPEFPSAGPPNAGSPNADPSTEDPR